MGLDGSTLYVANTGSETVTTVDLDQQQVTGTIQFPPIPRAGNAAVISVSGMAMGLSGLQLVRSDGNLWSVSAIRRYRAWDIDHGRLLHRRSDAIAPRNLCWPPTTAPTVSSWAATARISL